MALKRATRRKLILLGTAVSLVAVVGALWGVRQVRIAQGLERDLRGGMAAYQEQRYEEALPQLSRYVGRHRANPDVLLAFADTRRLVPAEDGTSSHLRHALAVTRLMLDLKPESAQGQVMLMEIAGQLGLLTEANDAAVLVLEQDPANIDAHFVQLAWARSTGRDEECITIARTMAEALPTVFAIQSEALSQMIRSGMPDQQLREFVEERRAAVQGRIASDLLAAKLTAYEISVAQTTEDLARHNRELAAHITAAISLNPSEVDEAVFLIRALDTSPGLAIETSADDLIQRYLADPDLAPRLVPFAVARAWQRGDRALLTQIAGEYMDASTLGDQSLGWLAIGLPDQTRLAQELEARSTSTARAWQRIAEASQRIEAGDFAEGRKSIAPLLAIKSNSTTSMAAFLDAVCLQGLGETSLAAQILTELAQDPVWIRSRVILREIALQRGDHRRVFELVLQDRLPGTELLLLDAAVSLDESGYQWPAGEANGRVHADRMVMNILDEPAILALHARAELAAGNTDRALQVADQLADMSTDRGARYVLSLADRLAGIDQARATTLQERWATVPSDPLEALIQEIQGLDLTAEQLRSRFEQATAEASPEIRLRGRMILAGVLEQIGDPAAAEEFVGLASENPTNAMIQIAALKSGPVWGDLQSVEPIIARLRTLTGEDGISWRVFQYKLDLLQDSSEATAAEVINGLGSVLRLASNDLLALQLMAESMTRVGDPRAANYAVRAADAAPDNLKVALDAVEALSLVGRTSEAATSLRAAVPSPADSISSHLRYASLLARFGLRSKTITEWTWLATIGNPDIRARAAVELARLGQTAQVESLIDELAALDDLPPEARTLTADSLALLGRKGEGLKLLDASPETLDAGERATILAEFLARHATTTEDLQELESFVRTTDSAGAWLALVRRYMGEERLDDARRVLGEARNLVDDPSKLATFERALDPDMELDPNAFLAIAQASLMAVETDWSRDLAAQLDLVFDGQKPLAELAEYLRGFVRSRPSVLLGWMLLSQVQATLDDHDAARMTTRTMLEAIPTDPAAASYAVGLYRRLGMPDEGLLAAREYADRIGTPTLDSGRNITLFALAANRRQEAWEAISPWQTELTTDQDLSLYARAALLVGRADEAGQVVWTQDQDNRQWTHEAVRLAALIRDPAARQTWLTKAATRLTPADDRGRFILADGWYQFALETGNAEALTTCLNLTEPDASDPAIESSLSLLQGSCLSQLGRDSEAIRSYRRVLELTPNQIDAMNNLAYILLETDDEPAEALVMAQRAVDLLRARNALPDELVEYLDTLGTALLRSNKLEEALAVFDEALAARPAYDYAIIGRAESLEALGRADEARQALALFDQLDPRQRTVPSARVKRIRDSLR